MTDDQILLQVGNLPLQHIRLQASVGDDAVEIFRTRTVRHADHAS